MSHACRWTRRATAALSVVSFLVPAASFAYPYPTPQVQTVGGTEPEGVLVADIDADGHEDLVSADSGTDNVSVLLGDGAGNFAAAVTTAVGSFPVDVASGFFDADANLDLAVRDGGTGAQDNVSILLGNGDGTFDAAVSYSAGAGNPHNITVADVDKDGETDLLMTSSSTNTFSVLIGNGDGTFDAAVTYSVGSNPIEIAVGDITGDTFDDVVVANRSAGNVSVYLNDGDGTFTAGTTITLTAPYSVVLADFDENGDLDLAVSRDSGSHVADDVRILLGNGDGTFGAAANLDAGDGTDAMVAADFNNDANLDLAVASTDDDAMTIFLGDGAGSFTSRRFNDPGIPESIAAGDFDEDGNLDAVTSSAFANVFQGLVVLLGNGDGTLQSGHVYEIRSASFVAGSADFDGDTVPDLAVADYGVDKLSIFTGNSDGTFAFPRVDYTVTGEMEDLVIDDFNQDGSPDLAFANNSNVKVLLNDGAGLFPTQSTYSTGSAPFGIGSGNFNGDLFPDLAVVSRFGTNRLSIFINNGDGTYAAAANTTINSSPNDVFVADLNGDTNLDIAVAHENDDNDNIGVHLGNGDGTFDPVTYYGQDASTALAPRSIDGGDFDDDGDIDLAVTDENNGSFATYLNDGSGAFALQAEVLSDNGPTTVDVADLDGDDRVDVVVAEIFGAFSVYLNDCDGTFSLADFVPNFDGTAGVFVADVDQTGNPDLIIANGFEQGDPTVYLSSGDGSGGVCGGGPGPGPGGGGGTNFFPETRVRVLVPAPGAVLEADAPFQIEWTTEGRIDFVNLAYSIDDGASWITIARGAVNSGIFHWTVPNIEAPEVLLRVEATDLQTVFASDVSDGPFAIVGGEPSLVEVMVRGLRAFINTQTGCRTFASDAFLPNPVSGAAELPGEVCPGDFISTPSFRTVYYVTSEFIRRPFFNAVMFLTHQPNFAAVKLLTDATLLTLDLGELMAPQPGTVLVKFQDAPGVYVLFENPLNPLTPIARLLENEAVAEANFGPDWSDYVIDLPPTMFAQFVYRSPIVAREEIAREHLLRRQDLERVSNPYTFAVIGRIRALIESR